MIIPTAEFDPLFAELEASGFKVEWSSYFNTLLFPLPQVNKDNLMAMYGCGTETDPRQCLGRRQPVGGFAFAFLVSRGPVAVRCLGEQEESIENPRMLERGFPARERHQRRRAALDRRRVAVLALFAVLSSWQATLAMPGITA